MGKLAKLQKGFKKAKLAARTGGGGEGKGPGELVHTALELGGSAGLMQLSKNVGPLPYVNAKPDAIAAILGLVGVGLFRDKKLRKYAKTLGKAGAHATLARWTYGQDKVQVIVDKNGNVSMGEESVSPPPQPKVSGKVRMRPTDDGRPEFEVELTRGADEEDEAA